MLTLPVLNSNKMAFSGQISIIQIFLFMFWKDLRRHLNTLKLAPMLSVNSTVLKAQRSLNKIFGQSCGCKDMDLVLWHTRSISIMGTLPITWPTPFLLLTVFERSFSETKSQNVCLLGVRASGRRSTFQSLKKVQESRVQTDYRKSNEDIAGLTSNLYISGNGILENQFPNFLLICAQ